MKLPGVSQLTRDERHEVHNERIRELIAGEISGKEFVASLMEQVGFTQVEASEQYHAVKQEFPVAIFQLKIGGRIEALTNASGIHISTWHRGKIVSFYAGDLGAIVELDGIPSRFPFSLYELRVALTRHDRGGPSV